MDSFARHNINGVHTMLLCKRFHIGDRSSTMPTPNPEYFVGYERQQGTIEVDAKAKFCMMEQCH